MVLVFHPASFFWVFSMMKLKSVGLTFSLGCYTFITPRQRKGRKKTHKKEMAKASSVAFLASALVVLAIAGSAHCRKAVVKKDVGKGFAFKTAGYAICDPCRLSHIRPSQITYPLPGSKIGLHCTDPKTWAQVNKVVTTNKDGFFEISVSGVHDGDNCAVYINYTPDEGCNFHNSFLGFNNHKFDNVRHNVNATDWSGELVLWPVSVSKKCNQTLLKELVG